VLDAATLHFVIKNNVPQYSRLQSHSNPSKDQIGGFGLANTSKRLQLLYPDKHELSVQQSDSEFIIDLRVELDLAPIPKGVTV
jgi:two-component system, LytTR family, sensor kinase